MKILMKKNKFMKTDYKKIRDSIDNVLDKISKIYEINLDENFITGKELQYAYEHAHINKSHHIKDNVVRFKATDSQIQDMLISLDLTHKKPSEFLAKPLMKDSTSKFKDSLGNFTDFRAYLYSKYGKEEVDKFVEQNHIDMTLFE